MSSSGNCVACSNATCGDGFVLQGQEQCDDGNNVSNDGCSAECVSEVAAQCLQPYNTFKEATRLKSFNDNGTTVRCDVAGVPVEWRARQLYHDREEITVYAGPAR